MDEKTTSDLNQEMMDEPNIDDYLRENRAYFSERSITSLLKELYDRKAVSKAALARRSGMSEVYLHQVFSGRRTPSRDKLICLCVGLEVSLEETQRLLKQAAYAQIYPRNKRDAIISHGIIHHTGLDEINNRLFAENEKTLF